MNSITQAPLLSEFRAVWYFEPTGRQKHRAQPLFQQSHLPRHCFWLRLRRTMGASSGPSFHGSSGSWWQSFSPLNWSPGLWFPWLPLWLGSPTSWLVPLVQPGFCWGIHRCICFLLGHCVVQPQARKRQHFPGPSEDLGNRTVFSYQDLSLPNFSVTTGLSVVAPYLSSTCLVAKDDLCGPPAFMSPALRLQFCHQHSQF